MCKGCPRTSVKDVPGPYQGFSIPSQVAGWQRARIHTAIWPDPGRFQCPWGLLPRPGLSLFADEPDRTRSAPFWAGLSTGWISWIGGAFVSVLRHQEPSHRAVTGRSLQLQSLRARGLKQSRTKLPAPEAAPWVGGPCTRGCARPIPPDQWASPAISAASTGPTAASTSI